MTTENAALDRTQIFENRDDVPASPMSKSKRAQKIAAARSRRRIHSSHYSQGYGSIKNVKKDTPSGAPTFGDPASGKGHYSENRKPVQDDSDAHIGWPDENNLRVPAPKCHSGFSVDAPGSSAPLQPISETRPKSPERYSSSSQRYGLNSKASNQRRSDENTNPSRDQSPILNWPIGDDSPSYKKTPSTEETWDGGLKRSLDDASAVLEEERNSSITSSSSSLSSAELSNIARKALMKASETRRNNKPSIDRLKRTKPTAHQRDDDDSQSVFSTSSRRSRVEKLSEAKKRTAAIRKKYEQNHDTRKKYQTAPGTSKNKTNTKNDQSSECENIMKDLELSSREQSQRKNDIDDKQLTKTVQSIIANALETPEPDIFSTDAGAAPYPTKSVSDRPADAQLQDLRPKTKTSESESIATEVKSDTLHAKTATKTSRPEEEGSQEILAKKVCNDNAAPIPCSKEVELVEGEKVCDKPSHLPGITNKYEGEKKKFDALPSRQNQSEKKSTNNNLPSYSGEFQTNQYHAKNKKQSISDNTERAPRNTASAGASMEHIIERSYGGNTDTESDISKNHSAPAPEKALVSKNAYLEHLQKQKHNRSKPPIKRLDTESSLSSSASSSSADESMQASGEGSEKRDTLSTDEDESIRGVKLIPSHTSLSQAEEAAFDAAFDGQFIPSKFLQTREEFEKKDANFREENAYDSNNSMMYSSADESSFKGAGMNYSSTDESTLKGAKFLPPSSKTDEAALVGQFIPTEPSHKTKHFEKKNTLNRGMRNAASNKLQDSSADKRKEDRLVSSAKPSTQSNNIVAGDVSQEKKSKSIDENSSVSQASDALQFWQKKYAFNQDDDVNRIVKKALMPSAAATRAGLKSKHKPEWISTDLFEAKKEKSQVKSTQQLTTLESEIGTHPWPQQDEAKPGSSLPTDVFENIKPGNVKTSHEGSDDESSQFSGSLFSGLDESTFRSAEFAKASAPFQGRDPLAISSMPKRQPFDVFPQAPIPPPPPPPRQGHCGELLDESELLATVNSDITSSILAGEGMYSAPENALDWNKRSTMVITEEASDDITTDQDRSQDAKSMSTGNRSGRSKQSQQADIKLLPSDPSQKSQDDKPSNDLDILEESIPANEPSQESSEEENEGFGAIFMNIIDSFSTLCRAPESGKFRQIQRNVCLYREFLVLICFFVI
mmetsp:Transcript_8635/g.13309  ORF Transcript_8635/g.13309 Transcript_8635/m.13309 type:complete len:1179 (+) Transcript_8635:89-3625(+)